MRYTNLISQIQTYVIGITTFFVIVTFFPLLNNSYFLPKLTIIQIGGSIIFLSEAIKLFFLKIKKYWTRFDLLLFTFLIINIMSWVFSRAPIISFFGIYKNEGLNLFYLPSFLIIASVFQKLSDIQKNRVYLFIIIGTLLSSLYTIIHYGMYASQFGIIDRPNGLDGHPIWSSATIGFGLLLLFFSSISFIKNRLIKYVIKVSGTIIHCIALFYLYSTTSWTALLLTFIFYWLIFTIKFYQQLTRKKVLLILLIFAILILTLYRLTQIKNYSIQKRLTELYTTLNLFKSEYILSPDKLRYVLLGHGQNTSGFFYIKHKDVKNINDKEWFINLTQLHNQFLELFFTIGLFGTLIWFILFAKTFIYSIQEKKPLLFVLSTYLFFWQQLYLLLPTVLLLSFLIFGCDDKSKKGIISLKGVKKYPVLIVYLSLSIFLIYVSFRVVYADYLFSNQNQYRMAVRKNPYNDEYIRAYTSITHTKLLLCKPALPDLKIQGCLQTNMLKSAREEFALMKNAVQINPLNPSNWNGYSASAFVISVLEPKEKIAYRLMAAKAGIQAYNLNPTEPAYADALGLVYLDMRDYKNGEIYFLKAFSLDPKSITIIKHLIELYKQTGNKIKQERYESLLI